MSKISQLERENEKKHRLKLLNNVLPGWIAEYKFHPVRRWRFDFCQPVYKIAIEIDGAVWSNGRHTRGSGFVKDMEKLNAATVLGYSILRFTPQQEDLMVDTVTALLLQNSEETF
jgi:very-short-patch-repair endonuclease